MIRPSEVRVFMSLATSSFFHVCATSSFSLVLHPHSIKFSAVIQLQGTVSACRILV